MDLKESHEVAANNGTLVREQLKRKVPRYVRIVYGLIAGVLLIWWAFTFVPEIIKESEVPEGLSASQSSFFTSGFNPLYAGILTVIILVALGIVAGYLEKKGKLK